MLTNVGVSNQIPVINDQISGISVVLEVRNSKSDFKSRIAFVIENEKKLWKNKGQISVPFGTIEKNEYPLLTAQREIKEELGIELDRSLFQNKGIFTINVITQKVLYKIKVYVFYVLLLDMPNFKKNTPSEIGDINLMDIESLLLFPQNDIRPGTLESIKIATQGERVSEIFVKEGIYNNY